MNMILSYFRLRHSVPNSLEEKSKDGAPFTLAEYSQNGGFGRKFSVQVGPAAWSGPAQ